MRAHLKTSLLLSLAAHFAAAAWAVPAHRFPVSGNAFSDRYGVMTIDLNSPPRRTPAARETPPADAEVPDVQEEARVVRPAREESPLPLPEDKEHGGATEKGNEDAPAGRTVRNEEFARLARIREMTAKTAMYYRSAPKGFEGILRSAMAPEALRVDGSATVSIDLLASGAPGEVDIRTDSSALLSALKRVRWEGAPLPAHYRIPCSKIRVNVSVAGERLAVGVEIL